MIISGGSRCNGAWFAKHLTRTDENERVRVAEMRGVTADNVRDAFREMHFVATGTFCKNYFYHASINPRENERLTDEQWEQAVDALERNLGLEGQPRFVVEHEKEGRIHRHIVWSRIDAETMTAVSDSFTAPIHERTARELEQEFGLEPVESVLVKDRGTPRPERGAKSWEKYRGFESGIDPDEVKREVTALWQQCDSGKAFARALDEAGYILCRGDRRDFCIVDQAGDEHSLARRIKGVKAADIRERMADVERESLPTVEEARDLADERADAASSSSNTPHHLDPGKLLEAEKDPDRDRPRLSGKAEPETPEGIPQAVDGNTGGRDEAHKLAQEMASARSGTVLPDSIESELQRPAQSPETHQRQRELAERTEAQWREATPETPKPDEGGGWWQRMRGMATMAVELFRDEGSGGSPRWLHMGEEAVRAWLSRGENRKAVAELAQDAGDALAHVVRDEANKLSAPELVDPPAHTLSASEFEAQAQVATAAERHFPTDAPGSFREAVAGVARGGEQNPALRIIQARTGPPEDSGGDGARHSGQAEPERPDGIPQEEPARPAGPIEAAFEAAWYDLPEFEEWLPQEDDEMQPLPEDWQPPHEPDRGPEPDGLDMG